MKTNTFFLSNTTSNPFKSRGRGNITVPIISKVAKATLLKTPTYAFPISYWEGKIGKRLKGSAPKPNMVLRTYNTQLVGMPWQGLYPCHTHPLKGDKRKKQHSQKLFMSSFKSRGKAPTYAFPIIDWESKFLSKKRTNYYSLFGTYKGVKVVKSGLKGFLSNKTNTINIPSSYWNQCFDKSRLKNFVLWFFLNHGEYKTVQLVEQLKNVGFEYATKAGISLGIEDLKIPPKKALLMHEAEQITSETVQQYIRADITGVERFQRLIDTWHRTSEQLKQEVIDNFEATDILNPVYMMAFSGARGNISQVRQLVGMRGLMANPQGQIIDFPIRSNFREGLTLTEYIISSYGARKGIVDTALRTANAGYLTRRLVDVAQHVIISNFDCGTRRGIFLSDMKEGNKTIVSLQTRLVGRVCARDITVNGEKIAKRNSEISIDLAYNISKATKKVFVRSALTCETKKLVCQLCYGWSLAQGNLVAIGEAIGVIAAQSIGEPGTQLTMRTFHTGGVFSGDISDQIRMPFNGILNFDSPIPGTLIRTPEGKIAFLTKSSGSFTVLKEWAKPLMTLKPSQSEIGKGNVDSTHNKKATQKKFKIPEYTLLFVRHGEFASEKEVVAQISSISKQKNATDDAELTIKSEIEGEFYLQRLRLKEIQVGPKLSQKEKENLNLSSLDTVKTDPVSHLKRVSPMDSIFTAWNWGHAWILSGKVYQSPQPSSFFPQIGDYLNKKSSIVISKTNNSFSNISGLVKLKKIAPPYPLSIKELLGAKPLMTLKPSQSLIGKVNQRNKNSLLNTSVNHKSVLPVCHFEFVAFQLSSILYKKFGYFTKLNWSTKSSFAFPLVWGPVRAQTHYPLAGFKVGAKPTELLMPFQAKLVKGGIKKFKNLTKNTIMPYQPIKAQNGYIALYRGLTKVAKPLYLDSKTNGVNRRVISFKKGLKNGFLTKNDSIFVIPPNGQVLLKQNLVKLYPSNWQSNFVFAAQVFPSLFQTNKSNTLVLEKISNLSSSGTASLDFNSFPLENTRASDSYNLKIGFNKNVLVIQPVTVKKTKNFKIATKKVSKKTYKIVKKSFKKTVSTVGAKPQVFMTPPKGGGGNEYFKINFSRILSIPDSPYSFNGSAYLSGAKLSKSVKKPGTLLVNNLFIPSGIQNSTTDYLDGSSGKSNGHHMNQNLNGNTKKQSLSNNSFDWKQKSNAVPSLNGHMTSSKILNSNSTNMEVRQKNIPLLPLGDKKEMTSPEIISKIFWNLKNKQKTKTELLATTKKNFLLITEFNTYPAPVTPLFIPLKGDKINPPPKGGGIKRGDVDVPILGGHTNGENTAYIQKDSSRKLIKSKKSFSFIPHRGISMAGAKPLPLNTRVNSLSHTRISKKVTSLSYKYIYEFSHKIPTLLKGFLVLKYDKKQFTSFTKFYNNSVFSNFLKQLNPNPQHLLDSRIVISSIPLFIPPKGGDEINPPPLNPPPQGGSLSSPLWGDEKGVGLRGMNMARTINPLPLNGKSIKPNITSLRNNWIYCLPTGIPMKKQKLVYPGQFINSELSFDQHIVSVKPFLIPTSSNLVAEPLNFKLENSILNNNCRFKKQHKNYSQIALIITKVDEFFINSSNSKDFLNLKNEISQLNQFYPDPTANLVSFKNLQNTYVSTKMINRSFASFQEKSNLKNFFINKQKISPEILPKFPSVDFEIIPNFSFLKESQKPSMGVAHRRLEGTFIPLRGMSMAGALPLPLESGRYTDSKTSTDIRDSLHYLPSNQKHKSLFSFFIAFKQPDFLLNKVSSQPDIRNADAKSSNLSISRKDSFQAKEKKESNLQLVYPFKEYKFDFSQGTHFGASWLLRNNTNTKNTKKRTLLTKNNLTLLNINSIFQSPILSSSLIHNLELPVLKNGISDKKFLPLKAPSSTNAFPRSKELLKVAAKFFVNPLAKGQYSSSLVTFSKTYSYCPFEGEILHITSPFNKSNFNFSKKTLSLSSQHSLKGDLIKQKTFNSLAEKESKRPMLKGKKIKVSKVNSFYQLIEKESSFLKIQQNTCMILTKSDLISFYLPLSNIKPNTSSPEGVNTTNLLNPLQSYVVKPTFVTLSLELIQKLTNETEKQEFSEASLNNMVYKLPLISSGFPKQGVQIKKRNTSQHSSRLTKTKKKQKQFTTNAFPIRDRKGKKANKTNFAFLLGDFIVSGDSLLLHSNSSKENLKASFTSKSAVTKSGQIIHLNKEKVTLRKGQPLFVSPKSILHKYNGDFIEPKSPIITLSYQRLKTGDIVQGIPKIEQFFEARTTKRGRLFRDSLPNLVKALYKRYREKLPLDKAVRQSFYKIQQIIVDGVLRVYRSQGVTIADKHLEIIVKQMTSKVRILEGGQTGFFPGEIVDLEFVEQVNQLLMKKIQYEPLVLGITKSSLEVDSFLSAASFQQTTRVLSGAAISRKKDFLKGLKENVILGNLIPAGTGYLVYLNDFYSKKSEYKDAFS